MSKLERILALGLGMYVALLPWQTRLILAQPKLGAQPVEYSALSLYATDILLLAIAFGTLFIHKRVRGSKNLWTAIVALVIIVGCSAIFANRAEVVLYSVRTLFMAVMLWWLVQQPWVHLRFLLVCFLGGAVLQALFGIGQFLVQSSPAFSWLGLAMHDPAASGTAVVEASGMRLLRAYGSLPHPNILGGYLSVALLVAFGFYLRAYDEVRAGFSRWTRENVRRHVEGRQWYVRQAWRIAALLAVLTILTVGLLLTFSRSAWLGFGTGWLVVLISLLVLKWPWGWQLWAKWTFFMGVIATFVVLAVPSAFTARTTIEGRLEQQSISVRQQLLTDAYDLIKLEPLRGVGYGNMVVAVYDRLNRARPSVFDYQPVHNIYLLSIVELGVLGGLVVLALLLLALRTSLVQFFRTKNWIAVIGLASLSCLLVIGLFDHYLWTLPVGAGLLWLVIGVSSRDIT
ncbi:MAG: O-antigen ligase family protein [bacterium]|nr:O-antigen ligase family protein [bacterium]